MAVGILPRDCASSAHILVDLSGLDACAQANNGLWHFVVNQIILNKTITGGLSLAGLAGISSPLQQPHIERWKRR
jgi:hypothetical protein